MSMTIIARAALAGCVFGACAVAAGCAAVAPGERDPMCAAIRDFANSDAGASSHAVELTTAWFPPGESVVARAACTDGGYPPGAALCAYLVQHASREFPVQDVQHALACTSRTGRFGGLPAQAVRSLAGEVRADEMPGADADVQVVLSFDIGGGAHTSFLRIAARRRPLPG